MPDHWPVDEWGAQTYEQSLSQMTGNQFLSLRQLATINATDQQLIDRKLFANKSNVSLHPMLSFDTNTGTGIGGTGTGIGGTGTGIGGTGIGGTGTGIGGTGIGGTGTGIGGTGIGGTGIGGTGTGIGGTGIAVYGIVDSIHNVNEWHKKVVVIDPTITSGVSFIVNNVKTNIVVKNILRLTNISVVTAPDGQVFEVNERKNLGQFHAFSYDYESDNPFNYGIVFAKNNITFLSDKPVAKLLEEWFAKTLVQYNSFDGLSLLLPSGAVNHSLEREAYKDLACLVIASQLMRQSIQLTVYDGTEPKVNVYNQYRFDFCQSRCAPTNQYHRFNTDAVLAHRLDPKRLVFVNVWRNKSNQNNDHYEMAERTTLLDGNDLLVLFNVQLSEACDGQSVKLNLRSGRHYGKGIRKVNRMSVLGRHLISTIRSRELSRRDGQTCATSDYNRCGTATDSQIDGSVMGRLLALGSHRLQALYWQQMKEQDFPDVCRNRFEFDFSLIETVLEMSRRLSQFPKTFTSFAGSCPQMKTIRELSSIDCNRNQLALIRAKIIDSLPKRVIPSDKFVRLKCKCCEFVETVRNHRNSVYANIASDSVEWLECPNCRQSRTDSTDSTRTDSKLVYFYSIVFLISDSNADKTRVCLTKRNAVNVFGVGAEQVLNELNSALRVDNILFEMKQKSDQNDGIDWIVCKSSTVCGEQTEVISLAPIHSFD